MVSKQKVNSDLNHYKSDCVEAPVSDTVGQAYPAFEGDADAPLVGNEA